MLVRLVQGKSSIMNLFLRFYDFKEGEILIDDIPIQHYSQEVLRDKIGLVPQDPFLFHGTVASNIRMYQDITDEEVKLSERIRRCSSFYRATVTRI